MTTPLKGEKKQPRSIRQEEIAIRRAVREFAAEMVDLMLGQMQDGRTGWDDPKNPYWRQHGGYEKVLCSRIRRHNKQLHAFNEADDANHLLMLWVMRGKAQP